MLQNITMDRIRFGLDLKLQNLSMVSIAGRLWDSQDVKNVIKSNFSEPQYTDPFKNWCEISKLVVQYANSINLPESLSALLKKTVLHIGQKIHDWILHITQNLGLDLIFSQKMYFSFGAVDEIKIFDLYWRDLMASDNFIYQAHYFGHSPLFSLACIYGCERFVKERKNEYEMLDELSEFYPGIKAGDEIYNIMSVFICMTVRTCILENVASPKRMFELCLEAGFSKAARFYWEKLDEVEKVSNLTTFAKKCFWRQYHEHCFLMEKYSENLLFLINQMGNEERSLFFADYTDEIIRLFLPIWPYQEPIVDLLKHDWNIESSRLMKMADFLISLSKNMNRLDFPLDNKLVYQIMRKAWRNIPMDEKLAFLSEQFLNSSFFLTLNSRLLDLLLNDPSITDIDGEKMDYYIKEGFVDLVLMGKFDFLNTIIETVFNFIPKPKEFLKGHLSDCYFVRDLMENDESFGFLDQFLDWSAESEAERARLKNKINTISVVRSLTAPPNGSYKFELAEKFLRWKLETDAEIKRFKENMKSYNFVMLIHSGYIRIKSGDLSWLRPNDSLVIHPGQYAWNRDNDDGSTFLKFEDATELNPGVVLGIKLFCSGVDKDFIGPDGCRAIRWRVDYVGTKVGDFVVFTVREIWNHKRRGYLTLDEVVRFSNAFIKFYYETDQEVFQFKKTKLPVLVTENLMEFLLDGFYSNWHVPVNFLDDFCKFCMMPLEKIEEIKMQKRSDIDKFLDTYLIDHRNFQLADYYLNWLFGEAKKTEVSKKFLNSSNKGALLCVSYLKEQGDANPFRNRDPDICSWLCLVDDMEKLKNDVFAVYENTPEWFPDLLDRSAHSDVNTVG